MDEAYSRLDEVRSSIVNFWAIVLDLLPLCPDHSIMTQLNQAFSLANEIESQLGNVTKTLLDTSQSVCDTRPYVARYVTQKPCKYLGRKWWQVLW